MHTGERILDVPGLERGSGFRGLDKQRAHGKWHLSIVRRTIAAAFASGGIESRIELAFAQERRSHVVLSKIRLFERLFDVQRGDRQRANHLKGEKADDVGGIVIGLEVEMRRQVKKFSESFGCDMLVSVPGCLSEYNCQTFAIGKRCLTTVGIMLVFFARHLFCDVVGFLAFELKRVV